MTTPCLGVLSGLIHGSCSKKITEPMLRKRTKFLSRVTTLLCCLVPSSPSPSVPSGPSPVRWTSGASRAVGSRTSAARDGAPGARGRAPGRGPGARGARGAHDRGPGARGPEVGASPVGMAKGWADCDENLECFGQEGT